LLLCCLVVSNIILKGKYMAKIKMVKKLTDKGFPVHNKHYETAHRYASKIEKKKFPKGYEKLKKLEHKLGKHELMAKSTKSGKTEMERKYKPFKNEFQLHEKKENKKIMMIEHKEVAKHKNKK